MRIFNRDDAEHQPYYCEENIWRWVQRDDVKSLSELQVVFLSAMQDAFIMGEQRVSENELGWVSWDYHVVATAFTDGQWWVFDLDTRLPFPCPAKEYVQHSFYPSLAQEWQPLFRCMSSEEYLSILKSDRTHMQKEDGSFVAAPPSWKAPSTDQNNILQLADMTQAKPGHIRTLAEMTAFYDAVELSEKR